MSLHTRRQRSRREEAKPRMRPEKRVARMPPPARDLGAPPSAQIVGKEAPPHIQQARTRDWNRARFQSAPQAHPAPVAHGRPRRITARHWTPAQRCVHLRRDCAARAGPPLAPHARTPTHPTRAFPTHPTLAARVLRALPTCARGERACARGHAHGAGACVGVVRFAPTLHGEPGERAVGGWRRGGWRENYRHAGGLGGGLRHVR